MRLRSDGWKWLLWRSRGHGRRRAWLSMGLDRWRRYATNDAQRADDARRRHDRSPARRSRSGRRDRPQRSVNHRAMADRRQTHRRAAPANPAPQPPLLRRGQARDLRPRVRPALDELQAARSASTPSWSRPTAPRSASAASPIEGFRTVTHREPMLSIDNTYNADELREFDRRVRKLLRRRAGHLRRRAEDRRRGHLARPTRTASFTVGATRGDGEQRRRRHAQPQHHPRACR